MTLLSVKDLHYAYPGSGTVLGGVSFEAAAGEVTAILGANGSGKTTLMKLMLGLLDPDAGTVYYNGRSLNEFSREELSRAIAWVPQAEEPSFPYKVREYLLLARAPYVGIFETPTSVDEEVVEAVLRDLGLSHLADREVPQMSGGERQLMLIGRALAQEPQALMLDEPTSHLDLGNKVKVLRVMKSMAGKGKAVVFSTHDPNEALQVADRVALLDGGVVTALGEPGSTITEEALERIYRSKVRIIKVDGATVVDFSPGLRKDEKVD